MTMPAQPAHLIGITFRITKPDGTEIASGLSASDALEQEELANRNPTPVFKTIIDPKSGKEVTWQTRQYVGCTVEVDDDSGMTIGHVTALKAIAEARGNARIAAEADAVIAGGGDRALVALQMLSEWIEADRESIDAHLKGL